MAEQQSRRILVVEDDRSEANILRKRLELSGFTVHIEERGASALSDAAEHRPDLVILDVKLPDISGGEVARQLRKLYHRWDVPIMMLTGMDQPIDQLRGFACGADAYLTKPYDFSELMHTIALLLGETVPT